MSALWAKFEIFLRKFCFFSLQIEQKARKFAGLSCLYLAFLIGKRNLVRAFAQKAHYFCKIMCLGKNTKKESTT